MKNDSKKHSHTYRETHKGAPSAIQRTLIGIKVKDAQNREGDHLYQSELIQPNVCIKDNMRRLIFSR